MWAIIDALYRQKVYTLLAAIPKLYPSNHVGGIMFFTYVYIYVCLSACVSVFQDILGDQIGLWQVVCTTIR